MKNKRNLCILIFMANILTRIAIMVGFSANTQTVKAYHGTPNPNLIGGQDFFPLTHFGSLNAAQERLQNVTDQGTEHAIIEVDLKLSTPITLPDMGGGHGLATWQQMLQYNDPPIISYEENDYIFSCASNESLANVKAELGRDDLFNPDRIPHISPYSKYDELQQARDCLTVQRLIQVLEKKGYDSVKYKNEHEDSGHTSYIVFRPKNQILKRSLVTTSPPETANAQKYEDNEEPIPQGA